MSDPNPCALVTQVRFRVPETVDFRAEVLTEDELTRCGIPEVISKTAKLTVEARIGGTGDRTCSSGSIFYGTFTSTFDACINFHVELDWNGALTGAHGWYIHLSVSQQNLYGGVLRIETNPPFTVQDMDQNVVSEITMSRAGATGDGQVHGVSYLLKIVHPDCAFDLAPVPNQDICPDGGSGGGGGGGGGGGTVPPPIPTRPPTVSQPGTPVPDCPEFSKPVPPIDVCDFAGVGIAVWGCVPVPSAGTVCDTASSYVESCKDPLWAWDHKDKCVDAPTAISRLGAGGGTVDLRSEYQVPAWVEFSDGRKSYVGNSSETVWTSLGPSIVQHIDKGVFRGLAGGQADVQANWRGLRAVTRLTVVDPGTDKDEPIDLVVVRESETDTTELDGSRTEWAFATGLDVLANVQLAMHLKRSWNSSIVEPRDRVAIVGFGSGAQSVSGWTDVVVNRYPVPTGRDGALSIGVGLTEAKELFKAARPEARKVVVLFTTACESSCSPSPVTVAKELELDGVKIFGIGMTIEGAFGKDCALTDTLPENPIDVLAGTTNYAEWTATPVEVAISSAAIPRRSASAVPPLP